MLFYIGWKPRAGQGTQESEAGLEVFSRWQPPAGLEFKAMYGRADAGGFCICEADSAETLLEAMAPWAGAYLDYDVTPIVEIDKAVEIQNKAIAFRRG